MVDARLFDRPREEDETGLGDYAFDVLPRTGEVIELHFKDEIQRHEVMRLEHVFINHAKPPLIAITVRRID
jgi:hypothetical protein